MTHSHLNQHKHPINQNDNPQRQKSQQMKEDQDHGPKADEDPLAEADAEDFARVPRVHGNKLPEHVEEERREGTDREEDAEEECGERLTGGGEGTDAQQHHEERGEGEEGREDDAEEEGGHVGVILDRVGMVGKVGIVGIEGVLNSDLPYLPYVPYLPYFFPESRNILNAVKSSYSACRNPP